MYNLTSWVGSFWENRRSPKEVCGNCQGRHWESLGPDNEKEEKQPVLQRPFFPCFLGCSWCFTPAFAPCAQRFFFRPAPRASGGSQQVLGKPLGRRLPRSDAASPRLAFAKQLPRSRAGAALAPAPRPAGTQPGAGEPRHRERANGTRLDRAKEMPPEARAGADSKPSPDRGRAPGAAPFNRCKQRKAACYYNVNKRRRQAPSPWIPRLRITRDEVKALHTLPVKRELSFSTRCKWGEKQLQSSTINCFIQASASSGRHAFECHPHKTPPSHPCRQPL